MVERGRDLRRVPVRGQLPRHRRAELKIGAGALWQAVGFAAGYLALLLFVAAPLRRYGSYTIADFAEARLGSAGLRLLSSVAVLVITGFYLVPQLKGAGIALDELTDLPYWVGVVVVGAIVPLGVALGGMRGITLRPGVPVLGQADRRSPSRPY